MKELINDVKFDYSSIGFSLKVMDSSHMALMGLLLQLKGFEHYHCDHNISMGLNLNSMARCFKCSSSDNNENLHFSYLRKI
ncbi:Proliferating cell nuclear antigen [Spatholobus suberectus]|nr:Proliferating cell nuclear antigen [Spatholobus suberectus]